MDYRKLKFMSEDMTHEEIGLTKYLASHACHRSMRLNLSKDESRLFKKFYISAPFEFLTQLKKLEQLGIIVKSVDSHLDLILTEFGLTLGAYNGADENIISSTKLNDWYDHQLI